MLHVGERLRSPMLIANAWHARSDAASSLVVAVGIVGNMMGYNFADSVAAVIVGFMIVRMGAVFAWEAVQELIDTGLVGRGSRQHPPGHHRYPRGRQPA
jgi:divalent metal cation (Fe/Co/Zn/Cd) transporter